MTEKRFTIKEFSTLDAMSSLDVICDNGIELPSSTACDLLNTLYEENQALKSDRARYEEECRLDVFKELFEENEQLKSENKRLTDKLNKIALELVDECISQGKATEISEMSYREFLHYRAENGKPMELQL